MQILFYHVLYFCDAFGNLASVLFTDFRFCMCLASWVSISEIATVTFYIQEMSVAVDVGFWSVDVTCCSRILTVLTLGLELITKDEELRKDPEIDALVVDSFSPSATKYCG